MKHQLCTLFVLLSCFVAKAQKNMEINLNNNWEFRKYSDSSSWIPAQVPGCVHTDLLHANIIPDPFFGSNERELQWIENEDWEYRTSFVISKKTLKNDFINLTFEGLDTYADVYLNDTLILNAENMFLAYRINVKNLLKKGENTIYIRFYSPVKRAKLLMANHPVKLPGEERVFVRKAQYQFGWDWGPRLVTSGIWKDVFLTVSNEIEVKQFNINFNESGNDTAEISIDLMMSAFSKSDFKINLIEEVTNTVVYSKTFEDNFPAGVTVNAQFPIAKRWYPNGLGEQNLYDFKFTIEHKGKIIFENKTTTGFSNIKLVQEPDNNGKSFYFTVNGKKVFAKGANLIPLHSFSPAATQEHYRKVITEASNMNMNMIRIWGGGIYESDYLYALCDSLGIMVWQDFMFACAMYPENPVWENEFNYQVNRLKHHPSIALWCGNNENDEGWKNWGWQKQFNYNDADSAYIEFTNTRLFNKVIPDVIATATDGKPNYHPSSPLHGWGRKESLLEGDAHYWGVWWGKQPFTVFNEKVPRFMSEYGFQGMPVYNSFEQFIPDNELYLGSLSMKNHQKHPVGYETIQEYMDRSYTTPNNLEDYIYVSQLLQASGMETAIEAHRRNMPYCMGTLFWQLNDCWPVTSWSVIDYYFNRKASYYTVKKAYQEVMVSVLSEKGNISTWLINDRPEPIQAVLQYKLITLDGKVLSADTLTVALNATASTLFTSLNIAKFLNGNAPENCVLYIALLENEQLLAEKFHLFAEPKSMALPQPNIEVTYNESLNTVTVSTDKYAHGIYLYTEDAELPLSDNFFNLLPNDSKEISLQRILPQNTGSKIKIKCLNTLYNK